MNILAQRYSWMANELNKKAYQDQIKGRRSPLKQFYPCPKALQFTAALNVRPLPPTSVLLHAAALTVCECHPGVGEIDFEALYNQAIDAIPHEVIPA